MNNLNKRNDIKIIDGCGFTVRTYNNEQLYDYIMDNNKFTYITFYKFPRKRKHIKVKKTNKHKFFMESSAKMLKKWEKELGIIC